MINVEKNLAVVEDLLLGTGTTTQNRNGIVVDVTKIDIPAIIDNYEALALVDTTKHRTAININDTAGGIYIYDGSIWKPSVIGGQFLGTAKTKGVQFMAQSTNEELTILEGTNAFSIESFELKDGASLTIEDGSTYKVL